MEGQAPGRIQFMVDKNIKRYEFGETIIFLAINLGWWTDEMVHIMEGTLAAQMVTKYWVDSIYVLCQPSVYINCPSHFSTLKMQVLGRQSILARLLVGHQIGSTGHVRNQDYKFYGVGYMRAGLGQAFMYTIHVFIRIKHARYAWTV